MSWRDELHWADISDRGKKKASFRGATFFVDQSDYSFGRRNIPHQYPKRDIPFIEDLGRDLDEFFVRGYVIQNRENEQNYFTEKNALIKALTEQGPGTLIHPFFGNIRVSLLEKVRITETFREGGIARFDMNFVEALNITALYPSDEIDHIGAIDVVGERVIADTRDGMGKIYKPNVSDRVSNSILDSVGELNKMIRSVKSSIQGLGPAQLSRALTILSEEYLDIDLGVINDACELGDSIIGMFNGFLSLSGMYGKIIVQQMFGPCSSLVRGITSGPMSGAQVELPKTGGFIESTISDPAIVAEDFGKTAVRAALAMNRFGEATGGSSPSQYGGALDSILIITASGAQHSANQEAVVNVVRAMALITAAKTAIRVDYTSHDSVIEIMDEVIDAINVQLLKLGNNISNNNYAGFNVAIADPDSYQALKSLHQTFTKSMLEIGASLAKIVKFEVPPDTISSLELAYNKYEDLDREKEVIARNIPLVKHPGFLPGGKTMEILNS